MASRRGPKIGRAILIWARVTREVQGAILKDAEARGVTLSLVVSEIVTRHYKGK